MGGKKRERKSRGDNAKRARTSDENGVWKKITYENAKFDAYYKLQKIVPEEEWDEFIACLKRPLPTTFRVTEGSDFTEEIKTKLFGFMQKGKIALDDGTVVEPPQLLNWYPNNAGWYYNISRKDLKTNKEVKEFTRFLQTQTDSGHISRQEAVSMIPPMFLGVEPEHRVLDMCAAPGSKTAQIIEYLHKDGLSLPSGCVVANDADFKRCYTLTHQIQRQQTPCVMVSNHDAQFFPFLKSLPEDPNGAHEGITKEGKVTFQFDRVLADVPCSGDGTMRKNPEIWGEWGVGKSLGLHRLQTQIAMRGVNLLKVGGRLVYSTCSMSPIENEAVVCEILRQSKGNVRLVDVSNELPNLKRNKGLTTWKVQDKDGYIHETWEGITHPETKKKINASAFPPSEEEVATFNLQYCLRMLPHLQDTGGFFVAVFEKHSATWRSLYPGGVAPTEEKSEVETTEKKEEKAESKEGETKEGEKKEEEKKAAQPKKEKKPYPEAPFLPFETSGLHKAQWENIKNFYGLNDDFPQELLMTRSENAPKISLVSKSIRRIFQVDDRKALKVVNAGVRVMNQQDMRANLDCLYRITHEGIRFLLPFVTKRKLTITAKDFWTLLTTENPLVGTFTEKVANAMSAMSQGCVILVLESSTPKPFSGLAIAAYIAKVSCHLQVPKEDVVSLKQLFEENRELLGLESASTVTSETAQNTETSEVLNS